jgi:ATP-dependent helicase/nuclease subunit A
MNRPRTKDCVSGSWGGRLSEPVHAKSGRVLTLTGNFRSRPAILEFVNRLFAGLLRPEAGGIAYTQDQWLRPGSTDVEKARSPDPWPAVELHWIVGAPRSEGADDTSSAEREARLVARRIEALMLEGRTVNDRQTGATRPLAWNDIAVLLRSPRTRAETYARVFGALGVPLLAGRGRFYESLEISDLVSLLQILDNPHQDIPLLAVLRSPLAGFTPDDLVCLRIAQRRTSLWGALKRFIRQGDTQQPHPDPDVGPGAAGESEPDAEESRWLASARPGAWEKARVFVEAYQRWRELSRVTSLSECLETILEESGYEAWLAAQPAPEPALNRVRRLLALTRSFDQFQRQGLHRFVRFVEDRRDSEVDVEPAAATAAGAVRLLSVHQSKGLEFPVVVLADLGKRFNFDDLRAPVILDEAYGLCPLVQPPGGGPRYASLPHWLAGRRQRREALGEELRLLYVACTRAREQLVLCGTASRAAVEERWPASGPEFSAQAIIEASHWLDWLGPWWFGGGGAGCDRQEVARLHEPEDDWLRPPQGGLRTTSPAAPAPRTNLASADLPALEQRLRQVYPHGPATREPGKVSVSQLRLRAQHAADEEARPLFIAAAPVPGEPGQGVDAATRGTAHHLVLESIPLAGRVTQGRLLETVAALRAQGGLSSEEVQALDLPAIIEFWQSDLGVRIQGHPTEVQRELPFTGRFTAGDLESLGVPVAAGLGPAEYLVVQGVIDLAVLLPDRIWLLDFKTDRVSDNDLADHISRYRAQLRLYAVALERIYRRPVTECWLHFLHLRRSVPVDGAATPAP